MPYTDADFRRETLLLMETAMERDLEFSGDSDTLLLAAAKFLSDSGGCDSCVEVLRRQALHQLQ